MSKLSLHETSQRIHAVTHGRAVDAAYAEYKAAVLRSNLWGLALSDVADPNWVAGGRDGDGETVEFWEVRTVRILAWCEQNGIK